MRIKLKDGKQKDLILLVKEGMAWKELASILNINEQYLSRELKNEMRLLSDEVYEKLCNMAKKRFDKFIIEKLEDNWGRSKGGINSLGSTIRLPNIKFDEKLAEFIGAVLGDGNINLWKQGKKIGVYHIRIAGDLEKEKDYHANYLRQLGRDIFNLEARELLRKQERFLDFYSKELVYLFISMGLNPGNKISNQSTIPKWVWKDEKSLRACVRGLIDTDGSIFRMSKRDFNLIRINFTNHNRTLLIDTREALIHLGFHPSKIINNRQFYLSRQKEIGKYLKEIGFSNKKHIDRAKIFSAP